MEPSPPPPPDKTLFPDEDHGAHAPPCTPDPNRSDLMIPDTIRQEEPVWCWAACTQIVIQKLKDTTIRQCVQANNRFHLTVCCNESRPGDFRPDECINAGRPEFKKYGLTADSTFNKPLEWADIQKQIDCRKAPICASWRYVDTNGRPNGGGHMAVISGYKRENGIKYVLILNPNFDEPSFYGWQTYSSYRTSPIGIHGDDFYNIRKQ